LRNDISARLSTSAVAATASGTVLRNVGIAVAASAFVAVCSHLSMPLYGTPVPLTLQPFAVLLIGLILAPRMAAASLLVYLGEGAMGLPVFSPGAVTAPGLAHLFGPTGGYLLSYPIAAMLISFLWRSGRRSFGSALVSAAVGNVMILSTGALWLAELYRPIAHVSAQSVLTQAIVPFLPGDALKVVAAATLAAGWQRMRRPTSSPHSTN
jgi:biotin transport system substrate-specific component